MGDFHRQFTWDPEYLYKENVIKNDIISKTKKKELVYLNNAMLLSFIRE